MTATSSFTKYPDVAVDDGACAVMTQWFFQPDDTPEDLLTSLINGTGLRQNLKRGCRPSVRSARLLVQEIHYELRTSL